MTTEHDHFVDAVRIAAAKARLIDNEEASRLTGPLGPLADATPVADPVRARLVDEFCVGEVALALEATDDSFVYALRDHCPRALVDLSRTVAHPDD